MSQPIGLSTYQWNNNIKSVVMLAAFPCLLIGLVALFFFVIGAMNTTPQGIVDPRLVPSFGLARSSLPHTPVAFAVTATETLAPFVLGVAAIWILIGTLFNEGLIRMATGALPLERSDAPEIYNLLENLCISRGMIMPKLFMIDTPVLNAYASGLSEKSFAVTVTRGLTQRLGKDELEAVLAHELSHIRHRDVRLLIVTVLFGGFLSFFAEMAWRSMRHTPVRSSNDKRSGSGAVLIVAALILFVGYLVATLFRLALSRRREFMADAGAVELTKNPDGLIRALQKIAGHAAMPEMPSGVQAMLIENPPSFTTLLDTHPPIESRIAVLRHLGGAPDHGASIIPKAGSL